jgi:hypothetical protein
MAQLGGDDLQAILDDLDTGSRARLMALIESFRNGDGPVRSDTVRTDAALAPGDWLQARLRPRDPAGSGMTPHALQALRRAALDSGWTDTTAAVERRPDQRGLLALLGLRS